MFADYRSTQRTPSWASGRQLNSIATLLGSGNVIHLEMFLKHHAWAAKRDQRLAVAQGVRLSVLTGWSRRLREVAV